MQKSSLKTWLALSASSLMLVALPAHAQDSLGDTVVDTAEDVVITTGERTVVNYLTSPLMDAVRKSLIEE